MQLALVIGHATSTVKHDSFNGFRLLVAQPLGVERKPEGDPVITVDTLGAGLGQVVVINSDGKRAREVIGDDRSPGRWFTVGLVDS
jgi:ethanolamine utilization protein EutN